MGEQITHTLKGLEAAGREKQRGRKEAGESGLMGSYPPRWEGKAEKFAPKAMAPSSRDRADEWSKTRRKAVSAIDGQRGIYPEVMMGVRDKK